MVFTFFFCFFKGVHNAADFIGVHAFFSLFDFMHFVLPFFMMEFQFFHIFLFFE